MPAGDVLRLRDPRRGRIGLQALLSDRPRDRGREDVRPGRREVRGNLPYEVAPVDGPAHRAAKRRVVLEERPLRIEAEPADARLRLDPEPRLVDAVPVDDALNLVRRDHWVLIDLARLNLVEDRVLTLVPDDVHASQVSRAHPPRTALPVRVAAERGLDVDVIARVEVRPGRGVRAGDLLRERQRARGGLKE